MVSADWRDKEFLSSRDISRVLDVTEDTARGLIHTMPYMKLGKLLKVRRTAFEAWLKEQERKVGVRHVR